MCFHCFDVLIYSLQQGPSYITTKDPSTTPTRIPSSNIFASQLADTTLQCPVFVTWEKDSYHGSESCKGRWQLRGCIGTLSPRCLVEAVGEYAEISAFRDRRFRPITLEECHSLRVAVSLLVQYEPCCDTTDWEVGVHGIMIHFQVDGQAYSGTYLPEVAKEQGWTISQTITSLIQKAGYRGTIDSDMVRKIQCTRYQSSKRRVTFEEYVRDHCLGIDPVKFAVLGKNDHSGVARSTWPSCKPM